MTVYFLDSSALIKCYVTEIGSGWLQSLSMPAATAVTYTFVAADTRLLRAADAEGLYTDNPHTHP